MDIFSILKNVMAGSITDITLVIAVVVLLTILVNVLQQVLFKSPNTPPMVFHLLPVIGSTITYGIDPFKFFFDCQRKVRRCGGRILSKKFWEVAGLTSLWIQYGDVYTFILLGRKVTVYLGKHGNQFILNGRLKDVNAEEIYSVLTTPVFGKDVIYDVPNVKFMEQKKVKCLLASHPSIPNL